MMIIDNGPRYRGKPIDEALAANPLLGFNWLPSDSAQLDMIEHSWKLVMILG